MTTGIRLCSSAHSSLGVVVMIAKLRTLSPAGERHVSHWLARVRRLRKFRNRLFGGVLFRREKRLGGLARSHDLLAIVATRLALFTRPALLLRVVEQELPRIGWLLAHWEGNSLIFASLPA
jgi:hypothetical protein